MLPFIATVALGGFVYSKKPKCSCCSSKWTWNKNCVFCGQPVCGECGDQLEAVIHLGHIVRSKGRYCKAHAEELACAAKAKIAEIDAYEKEMAVYAKKRAAAEQRVDQVELFPQTFKGQLNKPTYGKKLTTPYFKNQDDARQELKIMALMVDMDCRVIQQVTLTDQNEQSGNYIYRVWSAVGAV